MDKSNRLALRLLKREIAQLVDTIDKLEQHYAIYCEKEERDESSSFESQLHKDIELFVKAFPVKLNCVDMKYVKSDGSPKSYRSTKDIEVLKQIVESTSFDFEDIIEQTVRNKRIEELYTQKIQPFVTLSEKTWVELFLLNNMYIIQNLLVKNAKKLAQVELKNVENPMELMRDNLKYIYHICLFVSPFPKIKENFMNSYITDVQWIYTSY